MFAGQAAKSRTFSCRLRDRKLHEHGKHVPNTPRFAGLLKINPCAAMSQGSGCPLLRPTVYYR